MEHIHLDTCTSTQKYLIELTQNNAVDEVLVSCNFQSSGVGQKNNKWDCYKNSLCMSFVHVENEVLSLTALEVGILVCHFFQSRFNQSLFLKWPNDILNSNNEKVGGIIINKQGEKKPIVGVGLNLFQDTQEKLSNYDVKAGFVFNNQIDLNKKEISHEFYKFITKNRLDSLSVINKWNRLCKHLNKKISLHNDEKTQTGTFTGIGKYGQALIENEGETTEYFTGTLRINN